MDSITQNIFFQIYVMGVLIVPPIYILSQLFWFLVQSISGFNTYVHNVEKLNSNKLRFKDRIWLKLKDVTFLSLLSWIGLLLILVGQFGAVVAGLQSLFLPKSEKVKQILYPLRANKNLHASKVWSGLAALNYMSGSDIIYTDWGNELVELDKSEISFSANYALYELKKLDVLPKVEYQFLIKAFNEWSEVKYEDPELHVFAREPFGSD